MRAGFISALFLSLAGFGIWFQQSYMEIYSQEFDIERKSDRKKSQLLNGREIDLQEYHHGERISSFHGREARILNSGQVYASGNLRYILYDAETGSVSSEFSTGKMLGQMKISDSNSSFLDSPNQLEHLTFPGEVVATSATQDRITGSAIRFDPATSTFLSEAPLEWKGPQRYFSGRSFRYIMSRDELSVGGPLKGNFIPEKSDFKGFKSTR